MSDTGEYILTEGDTFLLPTNAIYRINDKLDDASDLSSVYSNEPEFAIGDGQNEDELYMDEAEFAQRLYKLFFILILISLNNKIILEFINEVKKTCRYKFI